MAALGVGTNYLVAATSAVYVAFTDPYGYALFGMILIAGSTPNAIAGYAKGCILIDGLTGIPYCNTGTSASASWVKASAT